MQISLFSYKKNSLSFESEDVRKRYLLHILLRAIIILAFLAFVSNLYGYYFIKLYKGTPPIITGSTFLFYGMLLFLSQKLASKKITYIFVLSLFVINIFVSLQWGADLPISLLFYSLIIVISGVLLSSREAILVSLLSCLSIAVVSYCEINGFFHPSVKWQKMSLQIDDLVIYTVMLAVIAIVSWLSNREIEKSLKRARRSEAALQRERDNLEEMVEKRTAQLQQSQIEKISQMYRFIEFGKLAAGLFHDFMTPLNLVSLNLENIKEENKESYKDKVVNIQKYLGDALLGTRRLEKFIEIARKQLHDENALKKFSLIKETEQVIRLFDYQSKSAKIAIRFNYTQDIKYYGNPHKFNQIITNLLSNALDSYANIKRMKERYITIEISKKIKVIKLIVSDNGGGMQGKYVEKIFNPLYTTKTNSQHMGFGLYLIKSIIEDDFEGTISVKSKLHEGSSFFVSFPIRNA